MPLSIDTNNDPISGFDLLTEAVIDASSLIYMEKAGFISPVLETLKLHTPKEITDETGFADIPMTIHHLGNQDGLTTADQQVIILAHNLQLPVISEDKTVLNNSEIKGLAYYNALMILNFLLYKKKIGLRNFTAYKLQLLSFARYGQTVTNYGEMVTEKICELIQP